MANLSNVTIFIKSFLRHGLLQECLAGIKANLPECKVLIIDDSFEHESNRCAMVPDSDKIKTVFMPFDSGFGAKSNEMIRHLDTPYVLIGSDDFDFYPTAVREGLINMLTVLEEMAGVAIASGRVNGSSYESDLEFGPDGSWVREHKLVTGHPPHRAPCPQQTPTGVVFIPCDLSVNYSLIRAEILGFNVGEVHWDDDVKIGGGEHGSFFVDVYRAFGEDRVAYVPGAEINELPYDPAKVDPRYMTFRMRALEPGRACLVKRGIKRWYLPSGECEYA